MPEHPPYWFVYMLRCADNSLYTGITTDLERRVAEHNHSDKGAKYTRCRRPVRLVYNETIHSKRAAYKREWAIKQLSKTQKEALIS